MNEETFDKIFRIAGALIVVCLSLILMAGTLRILLELAGLVK